MTVWCLILVTSNDNDEKRNGREGQKKFLLWLHLFVSTVKCELTFIKRNRLSYLKSIFTRCPVENKVAPDFPGCVDCTVFASIYERILYRLATLYFSSRPFLYHRVWDKEQYVYQISERLFISMSQLTVTKSIFQTHKNCEISIFLCWNGVIHSSIMR